MAALVLRDMSVEKHSFGYFVMSMFSIWSYYGDSDKYSALDYMLHGFGS